eukprot:13251_1
MTKANVYIQTTTAIKTRVLNYPQIDPLHFNIPNHTHLSVSNLLSVILYCDYTELSSQFSKTFRNIDAFETLSMVINRHKEYANWAKTLRETVEYFGNKGWIHSDLYKEENEKNNHERGPFYCGMNRVMILPEFSIRLCSPTSTSKKFEVAARFGGENGIIIELNNKGYHMSSETRSWNCSWISNYSGENERLFIGGAWPIRVIGITNIRTKEKFARFLGPLFCFDCMIGGATISEQNKPHLSETYHSFITKLIKQKIKIDGYQNDCHEYINNSFEAFANHKTEIVMNLMDIKKTFGAMQSIIMNDIIAKNHDIVNITNEINSDNLFKPVIFKLFPNITKLVLFTAGIGFRMQYYSYPINLLSLLSLIEGQRNVQIIIKAIHKYEVLIPSRGVENTTRMKIKPGQFTVNWKDVSWISKLCNNEYCRNLINASYVVKSFDIFSFQHSILWYGYWHMQEDFLVIKSIDKN